MSINGRFVRFAHFMARPRTVNEWTLLRYWFGGWLVATVGCVLGRWLS